MKTFFIFFIMILFSEIALSQQVRFGLDPGFAMPAATALRRAASRFAMPLGDVPGV
jgi:hypothetical protein